MSSKALTRSSHPDLRAKRSERSLRSRSNGIYQIFVYDNNYPDETKVIDVDTNDNTFSYVTSTNPNEPASAYEGQGLNLSGTNGRLVQQKCDFCYEDNSTYDSSSEKPATPAKTAYVQVWHQGYGGFIAKSMHIRDDQGRRLGILDDGSFVNEIPGAKVHEFRTYKKPPKENGRDYLYLLPSGINYFVSFEGSRLRVPCDEELHQRDLQHIW